MAWNTALAREYIEQLADDVERTQGISEAIKLRRASDDDLAHPATMRAFVRGARGFDLALDCTMIFFYAICLGDERLFGDLLSTDRRMRRSGFAEEPTKAWHSLQDAFWSRPDIGELERIAMTVPGERV